MSVPVDLYSVEKPILRASVSPFRRMKVPLLQAGVILSVENLQSAIEQRYKYNFPINIIPNFNHT